MFVFIMLLTILHSYRLATISNTFIIQTCFPKKSLLRLFISLKQQMVHCTQPFPSWGSGLAPVLHVRNAEGIMKSKFSVHSLSLAVSFLSIIYLEPAKQQIKLFYFNHAVYFLHHSLTIILFQKARIDKIFKVCLLHCFPGDRRLKHQDL